MKTSYFVTIGYCDSFDITRQCHNIREALHVLSDEQTNERTFFNMAFLDVKHDAFWFGKQREGLVRRGNP